MLLTAFLGFILGFITAIPLAGPISALILNFGLKGKYRHGRWLAAGAGISEGIYCFLAFAGMHYLLTHVPKSESIAKLTSVVIMVAMGLYFYRSQKMREVRHREVTAPQGLWKSFFLGVSVAALNLALLFTWSAIAAYLRSARIMHYGYIQFFLFSVGVAGGILAWFSIFLLLIKRHKHKLEGQLLDRLLKVIGGILIFFGLLPLKEFL